jgi:hypothetical protein
LSSNYTLKFCERKEKKLHEYLEVIDTDLASIHADFSDKIKGAFIHSAGYVNLSDEVHRIKFSIKTLRLQNILIYFILYKSLFISVLLLQVKEKGSLKMIFII